jgi:hypothetical protein
MNNKQLFKLCRVLARYLENQRRVLNRLVENDMRLLDTMSESFDTQHAFDQAKTLTDDIYILNSIQNEINKIELIIEYDHYFESEEGTEFDSVYIEGLAKITILRMSKGYITQVRVVIFSAKLQTQLI